MTEKITNKLAKDLFLEFVDLSGKEYNIDYDEVIEKNKPVVKEHIIKLSDEEIKEIKLNVKVFYEEKDKVISNRLFTKRLVCGIIIVLSSLFIICCNGVLKKTYAFLYVIPFIYAVYIIAKAFMQKERIYCNSFINIGKKRNRLTSDGEVVMEKKVGVPALILTIFALLHMWYYFVMVIFILSDFGESFLSIVNVISMTVIAVALVFSYTLSGEKYPLFGKYKYYYNDKWYEFDR